MRRRQGKAKLLLEKQRRRIRRCVSYTLVAASLCLLGVILAGMVMLIQVEYCRFPSHSKRETFEYEIVFARGQHDGSPGQGDVITKYVRDGKVTRVVGPKIDTLTLSQFYGTVTFVANDDVASNTVKFRVTNRAQDKYYLPKTTFLDANVVEVDVPGASAPELRANVTLRSLTSNTLTGSVACRRADVEVEVPTSCLLDETKLRCHVTKGDITTTALSNANFEEIALSNDVGDIEANDLHAFKVELNTSTGTIGE